MRNRNHFFAAAALVIFFTAVFLLASCGGGGSSSSNSDDGSGGSTGGGTVGGDFSFNISTAFCYPGDTINFTLLNGAASYQFGYADAGDIQSYDDVAQMQATFSSSTGVGSYTVGSNGNCTDRLAAQDSTGALCYLTITVGDSGGGTTPPPPPPPPTGGGSGGTGGATGYANIANGYSYCPDTYDGTAWPLVLLLHGMGGTADYFISEYKWAPTARTHKIILCSLQSQSTYWGSGDEQNLLNMIDYMKSKYNVRLDKIVVFGFSNGATYAWSIGFKYPDIFKAIIACSNNGNTYNADDSKKVPCYVMWGAGESTHPGERTANELIGRGWDVTTRQHSSGHTVPQNEIPAMADWLDAKIP